MSATHTSQRPSSSSSGAFVDAEDIWRSVAPSAGPSSHNSIPVIPPHFPPPRGLSRLISALRSKFSGVLKLKGRREEYNAQMAPNPLPAPPPAPWPDRPRTQLHTTQTGSSSSTSTSPSSDSNSSLRRTRLRQRVARKRQVAPRSSTQDTGLAPGSKSRSRMRSSPSTRSQRTASPPSDPLTMRHDDQNSTAKSTHRSQIAQEQDLVLDTTAALVNRPASLLPSEQLGGGEAPRIEDADGHSRTAERFRVFSFESELAYIDAGQPYHDSILLTQRAYPRLQDVPADQIQLYLSCSATERARVPEDAWQGIIRRSGPSDRVYVHIRPGGAEGRSSVVSCDAPKKAASIDRGPGVSEDADTP